MSAYGGLGPMTNGVLWMMAIITAVFVALRLYTRHQILNAVGVDDYLCFLALVSKDHHKVPLVVDSTDANVYATSADSPHHLYDLC